MSLKVWLHPTLLRIFPATLPGRPAPLRLEGALNEQFSFQVALRLEGGREQSVRVEVLAPAGWSVRVRRVGYVPLRHHNTPILNDPLEMDGLGRVPGFVPDPLFEEAEMLLPAEETHAFWVTLRPPRPPRPMRPGTFPVQVLVTPKEGRVQRLAVRVRLHDLALEPRKGFAITHWFYADALIDWYKTDLFDSRFWEILPAYLENLAAHGQDTLYVPVFTPPLDGVKRPSQLLRVSRQGRHGYQFDWRDVKRYVDLARRCGIRNFEWCHPFTQWGVKRAIRVYEGQGRDEKRLWPPKTGAVSPTYRNFLAQYLPRLHRFLSAEGLLGRSFFHVSDEPHGEEHLANYRKARALLRELAPWMKVMDALSEIEFAQAGLTDLPVPTIRTAPQFVEAGIPCWCYYCCGPRDRFLNRLLDTPLAKIAMHGLLFYRWPFQGFLHWGYNYWYQSQSRTLIDPFTEQAALRWPGWAAGDPFVVYPGPQGPLDSIRWEVFGESLQDYRLLQTLGLERADRRLAALKSFSAFPKAASWRLKLRAGLLAGY